MKRARRYANVAEVQRAEAARTILERGGYIVEGDERLTRLAEILSDHHDDVELCRERGVPTDSIDVLATEEVAGLLGETVAAPNYMEHYAFVSDAGNDCLSALEDILSAETDGQRKEIIASYAEGAYPSLKAMTETAVFGAATSGEFEQAYKVLSGIRAIPELCKVVFAA